MSRIAVAALALLGLALTAHGGVILTEIMYNPHSVSWTNGAKWVEIYNNGTSAVDIGGWYLDDNYPGKSGALPAGASLAAGEIAVISGYPSASFFRTHWRSAWNVQVFAVDFTGIDLDENPHSGDKQRLQLKNSSGVVIDTVEYYDGNDGRGWPADPYGQGGPSIYLLPAYLTATGNDVGSHWALSVAGKRWAVNPTAINGFYTSGDIGSPGDIWGVSAPEPATLLLLSAGALLLPRRRA